MSLTNAPRNMKPGGYIHHMEIEHQPCCDDGTLPTNNILGRWADLVPQLNTKNMRSQLAEAGFVDIVERRFKLPLGPWSSNPRYQNLGRFYEMFWRTGLQGWLIGATMTRDLGWTSSGFNAMVDDVFELIDAREVHVYYEAVVMYASKPPEMMSARTGPPEMLGD